MKICSQIGELNKRLTDLCFAICRFSQVAFITSSNLTHTFFSISNSFGSSFKSQHPSQAIVFLIDVAVRLRCLDQDDKWEVDRNRVLIGC